MSLRKKYQKQNNVVLDHDTEVHHIIPKHMGGTDEMGNLEVLSKIEHAQKHLELYLKYGNFRDLCAYYMIGYNFTEAHKISSSEGGKIGGKKVFENKTGIFRSEKERQLWASMGGKIGGKKQAQLGLGFHQYKRNPDLHRKWASMGGKKSGQFQKSDFQSEMGKRGGAGNKGFIWINDGTSSFKYTKKQQQVLSLEDYLTQNPNIRKGRLKKNEDSKDNETNRTTTNR